MEVLARLGRPYEEWIETTAKIYADWDNDEFYVLVSPKLTRYDARDLERALDQLNLEMLSEEESPAEDEEMSPGQVWKKIALVLLEDEDEDD